MPAADADTDQRPLGAPWAAVAAVAGGLLHAAVFAPLQQPWAVVPAVVCLLAATRGQRLRRAAWLGALHGAAFMLALLRWNQVVGWDAWVVVSLLETAFLLFLGPLWAVAQRSAWWPLIASATWVTVESARSHFPFGGFPWGKLAFGMVDTPMDDFGRLGGSALVGFLVVLTSCALVAAVRRRRADRTTAAWLVLAVAVPLVGVVAPAGLAGPTGRDVRVAVVQGGVPGSGLDPFAEERAVLDNHVRTTHRLARQVRAGDRPRPDVVLWPENSSDMDPYADRAAYAAIDAAVRDVGVPVIVGAVVDTPDPQEVANTGIVWSPQTGPGQTYVKRHPVPFGEYLPFRDFLSEHIERFRQVARDFVQGQRVGSLDVAGTTLGDLICFEVAYDGLTRDLVDHGAEVVLVQTNNATWARDYPLQLEQQFQMSRYRAVESGRYVVVASTNGVSGVVGPDGSVVQRSSIDAATILDGRVRLADGTTWGVRLGWWTEVMLAVAGIGGVAVAGRRGSLRSPRDARNPASEEVR